jgi:hypothetical protein
MGSVILVLSQKFGNFASFEILDFEWKNPMLCKMSNEKFISL